MLMISLQALSLSIRKTPHPLQWTAITLLAATSLSAFGKDPFTGTLQPAFEESCIECHGEDDKVKGDLNLLEVRSAADLMADPERLQDMIDVLDFEEMPPEKEEPLEPEIRSQLMSELKGLLDQALASRKSFPKTPIRRMNRFQYSNAVQDLFKLKVEVFALPERMLREHGNYFQPASGLMPDSLKAGSRPLGKSQLIDKRLTGVAPFPQDLRAENGFDNRADHLSLSPLLLESFLKLSRSIVDSVDFNERTCGIWERFFEAPSSDANTESVVRDRLRKFLTQAFRRPVDDSLLERYAEHVTTRIRAGESFTDGMKAAASAALTSPRFLYLYDRAASDETAERTDDFELASRLSFFLWGSLPDHALIELASKGKLRDLAILDQQIERMLKDERLKRFCDSFPTQWLQLERIISSVPDPEQYPNFYFAKFRASMHMMLEPLLLFETILVENRPILELIDSNYSYRSELLDAWYRDGSKSKRSQPTAIPFERVLLEDRRQGGVITTAAVMTMTSSPTRTKPITRGAWIASVIFNNPPEPPPADVPPLPEEDEASVDKNQTLRERFEAHRSKTECAGCHIRIDPLGFAFESYGPTGLWRERYENGRAVDASGTLFRKHPFENILEFKDAILAEKDRFTQAFAGHLLSFALGRETSIEDSPALDRIAAETAKDGYRMQTMIREVILSEPFQRKSKTTAESLVAESRH